MDPCALPPDVQAYLTPDEQQQWLAVYQDVLAQTQAPDKARVAAWGAVRKSRWPASRTGALRRRDDGLYIVEGWGMKFTGPQDPDYYGTHFSPLAQLLAEYYPDAPLWYEHGWDSDYGFEPIGKRHRLELYGFGVWVAHVLWPDHPLLARTLQEIERGALAYSSDSLSHYAEQGFNRATGEMRMWPLAGWSLTKEPAEESLGPVTLEGMAATIREVVQAPARHIPLAGGRAILTLTACKSGYQPQVDPPVPAATPILPSEAQVAQGQSEDPLQPSSIPFRSTTEETPMDPQLLADLAAFLGVEATPDAVRQALQQLLATLESGTPAAESAPMDAGMLRSALDLTADAPDDDVLTALRSMADLLDLQADAEADDPTPTRDYTALARAAKSARVLADQTPRNGPVPFQTAPAGGGRAARSARSSSYPVPNLNRGADQPGLYPAIMAALGYKPTGFKGTLNAIRRDLFQMDHAVRYSSGEGPSGAWVLNTDIADDIIEPLVDKQVLFEAGAYRFPMGNLHQVTITKQVGVPGAYWAAETTEVTGDEVDWATASLTLKELRAPTQYPNGWLQRAHPRIESMLKQQLIDAINRKLQYSALFGAGGVPADGRSTGQEPLGVRWTPGIALVQLNPAREPDLDDLATAYGELEDNNIEEKDTWAFISASRLFRYYENMRDDNGQPVAREYWSSGVRERALFNFPYYKTNAVPRKLGSGQNETVNFFGDWSELAVGMGDDVVLFASEHTLARQNMTYVHAIVYADTAVMVPKAFHVTTGLTP